MPSRKSSSAKAADETKNAASVGKAAESKPIADSVASNESAKSAKQPNVVWRGEKDPPPFVRVGMLEIKIPDAAEQKKGFYSEHADLLRRSVPGFKEIKPKG